jgi:esterase/lipase superfamily enzyme
VYIHGFRTEFDDALYRLAQLSYDLGIDRAGKRIPFGMPFLFSWPARGGVLDYPTDSENAHFSEDNLRAFLDVVVQKSGAKNVHLIAHSMGNYPLIEVLAQIGAQAKPGIRFNQIVLAAPDIDRSRFLELAAKVRSAGKNITLYASSSDEALQLSKKAHSNLVRAGDVPRDGPVVFKGIDTIDVSDLGTAIFWSLNHSTYAEDTNLVEDLGKLLRQGLVPPHDRTKILGRRELGDYWYWVFPKPKAFY